MPHEASGAQASERTSKVIACKHCTGLLLVAVDPTSHDVRVEKIGEVAVSQRRLEKAPEASQHKQASLPAHEAQEPDSISAYEAWLADETANDNTFSLPDREAHDATVCGDDDHLSFFERLAQRTDSHVSVGAGVDSEAYVGTVACTASFSPEGRIAPGAVRAQEGVAETASGAACATPPVVPRMEEYPYSPARALDASITQDYAGVDDEQAARKEAVVDAIIRVMPLEWRTGLYNANGNAERSVENRVKAFRKVLLKNGLTAAANALRAIAFFNEFVRAHGCASYPVGEDTVLWMLEEYGTIAEAEAGMRASKRDLKGLPKSVRCANGAFGVRHLRNGFLQFAVHGSLQIEVDSDRVKDVARTGCRMPVEIRGMLPFDGMVSYETVSRDPNQSEFVRAYAGAGWLEGAGSARTIDLQRTPNLWFEQARVDGKDCAIACGIAARSKGSCQKDMRPLHWRAPLVAFGPQGPDLEPLLASMAESGNKAVFRDFHTRPGEKHVITNAISWKRKAASFATIVASQRAILDLGFGIMGTPRRATDLLLGGHDHRHMMPEAARAARLPLHEREQLGYWRSCPPASGDHASHLAAVARAVMAAREKKPRSDAYRFQSDRYSAAHGATVASDHTRVVVARLIARALRTWREEGRAPPASRQDQLKAISDLIDATA